MTVVDYYVPGAWTSFSWLAFPRLRSIIASTRLYIYCLAQMLCLCSTCSIIICIWLLLLQHCRRINEISCGHESQDRRQRATGSLLRFRYITNPFLISWSQGACPWIYPESRVYRSSSAKLEPGLPRVYRKASAAILYMLEQIRLTPHTLAMSTTAKEADRITDIFTDAEQVALTELRVCNK